MDEINREDRKLQQLREEYRDIYEKLCKLNLQKEVGPNYLYDLVKLTTRLAEYVARNAENVKKEVVVMGGHVIDTGSDAIMEKGIALGISQGISQSIVRVLQCKGEVDKDLCEKIYAESDENTLNQWLQLSAEALSVEEFVHLINQ